MGRRGLYDEIDQPARHDDDLFGRSAFEMALCAFVGQGGGFDHRLVSRDRHADRAAMFAVDLYHQLDFLARQRAFVDLRKRLTAGGLPRPQFRVKRFADMRHDWIKQQGYGFQRLLANGAHRCRIALIIPVDAAISVEEFHDSGDGRIELLAPAVIIGHLADRLVKLAAEIAQFGGELPAGGRCIGGGRAIIFDMLEHQPPQASQEAVSAFDAGVRPFERLIGR